MTIQIVENTNRLTTATPKQILLSQPVDTA